jgi:hypothetical protein
MMTIERIRLLLEGERNDLGLAGLKRDRFGLTWVHDHVFSGHGFGQTDMIRCQDRNVARLVLDLQPQVEIEVVIVDGGMKLVRASVDIAALSGNGYLDTFLG